MGPGVEHPTEDRGLTEEMATVLQGLLKCKGALGDTVETHGRGSSADGVVVGPCQDRDKEKSSRAG